MSIFNQPSKTDAHLDHANRHQKLAAEARAVGNERKADTHTRLAAIHFHRALQAA